MDEFTDGLKPMILETKGVSIQDLNNGSWAPSSKLTIKINDWEPS
jgi:hypothetical protein